MSRDTRSPDRKPRRWRRRLLILLGLLLLLIALAPRIVAHTGLRNWVAGLALSDVRGTVTVGDASAGWFAPVVLRDVVVRDENGQPVLTVAALESERTVLQLLTGSSDLGKLRCDSPTVHVTFTGQTSNVERVFAAFLQPSTVPSSGPGPALALEVSNARLEVRDADAGKQWAVGPLALSVALPGKPDESLSIRLRGEVPAEGAPGRVDVELNLASDDRAKSRATAKIDGLPLAVLSPVLRRFDPTSRLDGRLSVSVSGEWDGEVASLDGRLAVRELAAEGAWIGSNRPALSELDVLGRVSLEGTRVRVEKAEIVCDLGKASFQGEIDSSSPVAGWVMRAGQSLSLDVDLARVARTLPNALRLREDTKLMTGRLEVSARSVAGPEGTAWEGRVHAPALEGEAQGQKFSWPEPVTLDFRAHQIGGLPVFDRVRCRSSFLTVEGSGSAERADLTATCDLDRLHAQLSRFLDLRGFKMAGSGSARLALRREQDGRFQLRADSSVRGLELALPAARLWKEDAIALDLSADGIAIDAGLSRLDTATLRMHLGTDEAEVKLLEAVADPLQSRSGKAQVRLAGDMGRWYRRLHPWVAGLEGWVVGGVGELSARVEVSPSELRVADVLFSVRNAQLLGDGLRVIEPVLEVRGAARVDLRSGAVEVKGGDVRCGTVVASNPDLKWAGGLGTLSGLVFVQADLARLEGWTCDPKVTAAALGGVLRGSIDLVPAEGMPGCKLDLSVSNLVLPGWRESLVRLKGNVRFDLAHDSLTLNQMRVESAALVCDAEGKLSGLFGRRDLSLAGKLSCDLEKLEPSVRPYLGAGIKMVGREVRPFRLDVPLSTMSLATLKGEFGTGWRSLQGLGVQCGAGELKATLADGWLRPEPIESTVNGGKLRLESALRLAPEPAELHLGKGAVIERAAITPELCAGVMRFVLPALANATQAEGQFSLSLDGGRLPLGDVGKGVVSGQVRLHSAKVTAAPLLRELATLLQSPAAATMRGESVVKFALTDGKVHHDSLEIIFPELTVRTRGWVGLDGTLGLVAEFPIPPKWLPAGTPRKAFEGQVIAVPLRGTVDNPKLDEKALRDAFVRVTKEAGKAALEQQLEKNLNKILKPK